MSAPRIPIGRKITQIRRLLLFYLAALTARVASLVPKRVAPRVGEIGGLLACCFASQSRRRTMKHLSMAFGDTKSAAEKRAICRRMFANIGRCGMEMLTIGKWTKEEIKEAVEATEGHARAHEALAAGKGVIFLTAHFGNWELFGAFASLFYDLYVIAREVRFQKYETILRRLREEAGLKVIYQSDSPREILKVLRRNAVIAVLPDHDIRRINGVFVSFFGRSAYTPSGPVALSLASGAPILPVFLLREGTRHRVLAGDLIWPVKSGDKERDIVTLTQKWSDVFEGIVRQHPDHWAWMHKRWDTTPEKLARYRQREALRRAEQ
jgi:Kdo2-lipid IVA lauroyltransferase/acyltransferase